MSTFIQTMFGVAFLVSAGGFFVVLCRRLNAGPVSWGETHLLMIVLVIVSLVCLNGQGAIANSGWWLLIALSGNLPAIGLVLVLGVVLLSWMTLPVVAGATLGQLAARLCRKAVNRS